MTRQPFARALATAAILMLLPFAASAAGGAAGVIQHADIDLNNRASLQRGAKYFVNYCMGCHSAKYARYARIAADLDLSEDQVIESLMFIGEQVGDTLDVAMDPNDAKRWFGQSPPDLSLVARSRGPDWIYSFLKSFYADDSTATGANNLVLPNASMPNVLWGLQGVQQAVFHEETDAAGNPHKTFEHFEQGTAGTLSEAQFDQVVLDLTNFLEYLGEPVALQRQSLGIKVLAFLLVFFLFAFALKKEFWRDVH